MGKKEDRKRRQEKHWHVNDLSGCEYGPNAIWTPITFRAKRVLMGTKMVRRGASVLVVGRSQRARRIGHNSIGRTRVEGIILLVPGSSPFG